MTASYKLTNTNISLNLLTMKHILKCCAHLKRFCSTVANRLQRGAFVNEGLVEISIKDILKYEGNRPVLHLLQHYTFPRP